jgi:ribosomal protein S4
MESGVNAPGYLSVDRDNITATYLRAPEQREVPVPVDIQLVVEYYNRLT